MVMRKTLAVSLFLGFVLMGYLNVSGTGNLIVHDISSASAGATGSNVDGIVSFAFGSFVVYFVIVSVIYLIMRSIFKSFGG